MSEEQFATEVTDSDGYVRVTVLGQVSRAKLGARGATILGSSARIQLARVLVDRSAVTGDVPTLNKFEIGLRAAADLTGRISLAILAHSATTDPFLETVTRNRGADVRPFTDGAQAGSWRQGRPGPDR